jgi:hypothetical protein
LRTIPNSLSGISLFWNNQSGPNNRNGKDAEAKAMANYKTSKKTPMIAGLTCLLLTGGSPQISLAASPLFFKHKEAAESAEHDKDMARAKTEYDRSFRELQLNPFSLGLQLFDEIDLLVKFYSATKDYAAAEQCLKFAIKVGGSYKYLQQLADIYKSEGKTASSAGTEEELRDWIAHNTESWNTGAAMRYQRFYCIAHMTSAKQLKEKKLYEVTLDNGMTFALPVTKVNWGAGAKFDPTVPEEAQNPPPDDIAQLASKRSMVVVFKGNEGPTQEFDYCVAANGRIYQATLTSDCRKQYLSDEQLKTAQGLAAYEPETPISILIGKEQDKATGWWKINFEHRAFWAPARECSFKVPDSAAQELSVEDRVLIFSTSSFGFLSYYLLSLKDGQFLKQVAAVEAPYRPPMLAYLPWQRPKDYGLESSLAQESEAICRTTLSETIDRSNGEDINPEHNIPTRSMRTPRIMCRARLANGMSFDLLVKRHLEPPPLSPPGGTRPMLAPGRGGHLSDDEPLDTNPILAEKGAPVTVLAKPVMNADGPGNEIVYSVFVGNQLCEALPTNDSIKGKWKGFLSELKNFRGVVFTNIKRTEALSDGKMCLQLENGTACLADKIDPAKVTKGDTLVLFWQPDIQADKFKILTKAGIFPVAPLEKTVKLESSVALASPPTVQEDPSTWANHGWEGRLPGPDGINVNVTYPLEVRQAAAVAWAAQDPQFRLPKWTQQFARGLREIWWDLITHPEPTAFTLNSDLKKTNIPKTPILVSDPKPVLPPTYVTGKAQVLITIEHEAEKQKVTAKIFHSDLPETFNHGLINSIESNSQHAIFKLPDVPQFAKASFLVEFSHNKKAEG